MVSAPVPEQAGDRRPGPGGQRAGRGAGREGDDRNHHAHVMTTTREVGPEGLPVSARAEPKARLGARGGSARSSGGWWSAPVASTSIGASAGPAALPS